MKCFWQYIFNVHGVYERQEAQNPIFTHLGTFWHYLHIVISKVIQFIDRTLTKNWFRTFVLCCSSLVTKVVPSGTTEIVVRIRTLKFSYNN